MTILVTGATGRLGRSLQRRISSAHRSKFAFMGSPRPGSSKSESLDVTDRDAVFAVVNELKPRSIIHLASLAGAACDLDAARTQAVNVDAVTWISQAATEHSVERIIFASSGGLYGDHYSSPATEAAAVQLNSRYTQSKYDAEQILRAASTHATGAHAIILRIFNVYGRGFDQSLVERLIGATKSDPVHLVGYDRFVRDYSPVDTVVESLLASLEVRLAGRDSLFNIGSGVPISNKRLVELLPGNHHFVIDDDVSSYSCADPTLAKEELGLKLSDPIRDLSALPGTRK